MDGVKVALGNRNDGVGCASMRERSEAVEPWYIRNNEFHAFIFAWYRVLSNRVPVLWCLSPGEGWDAVS